MINNELEDIRKFLSEKIKNHPKDEMTRSYIKYEIKNRLGVFMNLIEEIKCDVENNPINIIDGNKVCVRIWGKEENNHKRKYWDLIL